MARIEHIRHLQATPEQIWTVLADFGAIDTWAPRIDHSTVITDLHHGPGTTRRVQSGRFVLLETIVDWEPNTTLAYTIQGLPTVVSHAENRWLLAPTQTGCDVTLASTVQAGSRPNGPIVAAVAVRVMGQVARRLLQGLATHLQGTPHD